jgi:hypothetical protein
MQLKGDSHARTTFMVAETKEQAQPIGNASWIGWRLTGPQDPNNHDDNQAAEAMVAAAREYPCWWNAIASSIDKPACLATTKAAREYWLSNVCTC